MKGCILVAAMFPCITSMQVKDVQEHLVGGHVDLNLAKAELMKFEGTKIDDAVAGLIQNLLNQINKTTFEALHDDKDHAQKVMTDAYNAVVKCNDDRTTAFSDVSGKGVFDAEELVKSTRTNHTDCKNHLSEGQKHLHGVMDKTCTRHNNRVKAYKNCNTNSEIKDSDGVYNWMRCLENFTTHHCDLYTLGREQCHNATRDHQEQESDCHIKQTAFESAVCSLDATITNACSHYEGCYDAANLSWSTTKSQVEDMEALFKAQMQALEQILCFGQAIIANHTNYDQCEFDTCAECPNMDITYLTPPAEVNCGEALANKPCDSAWLTTEYLTQWSNNSADFLATCQACPAVSPAPSPAPAPTPPELGCGQGAVVSVPAGEGAFPGSRQWTKATWAGMCASWPAEANAIRVTMDGYVNWFKPISGSTTLCEMMQSNQLHQVSEDGCNWFQPDYYTVNGHLGGCQPTWGLNNFKTDQTYCIFWGDDKSGGNGGCCGRDIAWNKGFEVDVLNLS